MSLLSGLRSRWLRVPRWLRILGGVAAVPVGLGALALAAVWWHYSAVAAGYDMAALTRGQNETLIVDARGEPVGSASEIERELVDLKELPTSLVEAVLATEDARFFSHPGFDVIGLTRAALKNFNAKGIRQGGSTITQQLARNAFGLQGRSYERKITEIFLAMRIEHEYSKEQILSHYLNRIYLGTGCSGVGAAARCYFGKDVRELTLPESATLAGIIKAPVAYSPITQPALARQKRDLSLQRMVDTGRLGKEEAAAAKAQPLVVRHDKTRVRTGYMLAAARSEFQRLGMKPGTPPEMRMTLRLDWQRRLDALMRQHLESVEGKDKDKGAATLQGAVIVLDNRSGAILAMQGGRDFTTSPFNRALEGTRPPGTGFLPLVYAAALTALPEATDTPLIDGPLDNRQAMIGGLAGTLGEWGADGEPVAYTGGTITPMQALLEGRTAATVRLCYQVGLDAVRSELGRCSFTTPLRTEAAFTLGQSPVRLIELARAFTAVANDGRLCTAPHVLLAPTVRSAEIFAPSAMAHIRETLIAGMTRPEYRAPLVQHGLADKSIAGYGGITYDRTDAWFAGMDRSMTCLVWVGHDKDAPINPKATAAQVALPLWAAVFAMVTEGKPHGWDVKPGLTQLLVTAPRAIPVGRTRGPSQPEPLPVHPVSGAVIGNDPYQSVGAVPRAVPVPRAANEE
ncbi:transglycosylase domain-containing protein [Prosthecobacter vanneervenii]|uniref:peptidoglycan glycosyltransferase n=1 Tax=Prosthecobacter vanneervenii TaxID=48466 RepID=A0A7W8DIM6_9BACT|nr:transglycosylase domain-containing protein [Prosthecobacter vanneervenii]MBB5031130.1 penicillin-binding protein 1A [Prosthecobacter vanneervenii]